MDIIGSCLKPNMEKWEKSRKFELVYTKKSKRVEGHLASNLG